MRSTVVRGVTLIWLAASLIGCVLSPMEKRGESLDPGEPQATQPASEGSAPGAPPPVGLRVGNTAPDFELEELGGDTIRLHDYRGQVVMLNFWATWCGFCRVELPHMQRAYETYGDRGFTVLAINVREEAGPVRAFVEDMGMTFPVPLDTAGEVLSQYRIRGLPTSVFIDQEGVILAIRVGPVEEEMIETYLAQAGIE
ncbi:MAG: redoxin domain-containing protein [Anaerolineae bacterium]|nr:redoxin domain-containing protein [Anaerolineae bacterium]